jgi:hypothetical protein
VIDFADLTILCLIEKGILAAVIVGEVDDVKYFGLFYLR